MTWTLKDVEYWVSQVLGYGDIEGLFIDDGIVSSYAEPQDYEILTNVEDGIQIDKDIPGAEVFFGATKMVIVPINRNYVIKIPFTGIYHAERGEFKYDENDNYRWYPNDYYDFKFVSSTTGNVCDEEIAMYDDASDSLKKLIAPNEFVCWYGRVPVYVQEKVPTTCGWLDDEEVGIYSKARIRIAEKLQYMHRRFYKNFILRLLDMFGIDEANRVLYEIDECIFDLHDENYGYRKDGSCILFDIAGYDKSQWFN